jgi:TM2 domain-containing membrane protein YozV
MSEQLHQTVNINVPTKGVLERNWLTALLLSIFLGWLGIDRFYLGSAGVGIIKLLTFGLFGILWLVDIIMIATKSVKGIAWAE